MRTQRGMVVLLMALIVVSAGAMAAEPAFLRRSAADLRECTIDLSTATARYQPILGAGDPNAHNVKGLVRFGELIVAPGGSSKNVRHEDAEGIFFVLAGSGALHYEQEKVPVKQNDFAYLPVGVEYGVANLSQEPLRALVMTFKIPEGAQVRPTPELMMANSDEVRLQVLASHGPTAQFKLLMGTTRSTRDKLAASQGVSSLFLMDFAPGGTNIPHRHSKEEELYYVLCGHGEMVAGTDAAKKEMRYPTQQGDAFYFARGTLVGFYSGGKEGEDHAQILAVRWPTPTDR
jgi:mannose-6-phosphate isomerase-like protein (cupin superfamily)